MPKDDVSDGQRVVPAEDLGSDALDSGVAAEDVEIDPVALAQSKFCCPLGHTLVPFATHKSGFSCDKCGEVSIAAKARMFGCRPCKYDVCERCANSWRARSGGEQLAPRTSTAYARSVDSHHGEAMASDDSDAELSRADAGRRHLAAAIAWMKRVSATSAVVDQYRT